MSLRAFFSGESLKLGGQLFLGDRPARLDSHLGCDPSEVIDIPALSEDEHGFVKSASSPEYDVF